MMNDKNCDMPSDVNWSEIEIYRIEFEYLKQVLSKIPVSFSPVLNDQKFLDNVNNLNCNYKDSLSRHHDSAIKPSIRIPIHIHITYSEEVFCNFFSNFFSISE